MIDYTLDTVAGILYVTPRGTLEQGDFARLKNTVDPYIEANGDLRGLVIDAPDFPGWNSFGAMAAHFRFVRDHHRHIGRIAVVTDSALGNVAEHLAAQFVSADIRHFPAGQVDEATQWVIADDSR